MASSIEKTQKIQTVLKVKHITQVLQEGYGKKAAKPKYRKGNKKNISRQMKTKEIRRNSSWKGKPRLRRKKKTLCIFLTAIR